MTNLKALLARCFRWLSAADSRLTKSAGAGIVLSIITALIVGVVTGAFKGDENEGPEPNISRALYETKVSQTRCSEDRFNAMTITMNDRVLALSQGGLTANEKVEILLIYGDYIRFARPIPTDMARDLESIVPPKQFARDHEEMLGTIQVITKVLDDLDRALPAELNRSPQSALSDPNLDRRLSDAGSVWKGAAAALQRTKYSAEFETVYTCRLPQPTTPAPPTQVPSSPGVTPTPFRIPSFSTPLPVPLATLFAPPPVR